MSAVRISDGAVVYRTIFEGAGRTPDKPALVYNDQSLSYAQVARLIASAAGEFARQGVTGPGLAVLALGNLVDFWILSLALRSLGLTTLAARSFDDVRSLKLERVRFVVANAADPWPGLEAVCDQAGWRLTTFAHPGPSGFDTCDIPAGRPPGGHILQTSGTTGAYKLVLMDPAFEVDFLRRRQAVFGIDARSVVNVFDFGGWTGVGYKGAACTWLAGGTVVIHQGRERYRALNHPGLTHCHIIPQILGLVLAEPEGAFARSETLRLSVAAGSITEVQAQAARERITPHLFSSLGSTETMTFAFTRLETPEDRRWHKVTPGRGVQVVDEEDRPLPPGREGRVRVSTAGGPTAYLQDDAATRACFRDGWFYPGDLGVIREDGRLALNGRVTDVINVLGHKIAPTEMEAKLQGMLGVTGVCLFSRQNAEAVEEAHVVIETPRPLDLERLGAALNAAVFGFGKAHAHFVTALPRNDMGKIQRQAVREQILGPAAGRTSA